GQTGRHRSGAQANVSHAPAGDQSHGGAAPQRLGGGPAAQKSPGSSGAQTGMNMPPRAATPLVRQLPSAGAPPSPDTSRPAMIRPSSVMGSGRMNEPLSKLARCAIYTRKSTEYNLDLAFNSLDAQREACEAYIKSQVHERWQAISGRYDDGAFSGAS